MRDFDVQKIEQSKCKETDYSALCNYALNTSNLFLWEDRGSVWRHKKVKFEDDFLWDGTQSLKADGGPWKLKNTRNTYIPLESVYVYNPDETLMVDSWLSFQISFPRTTSEQMHALSYNAHFILCSSQKRHTHVSKIYSVSKFTKTRITCYLCFVSYRYNKTSLQNQLRAERDYFILQFQVMILHSKEDTGAEFWEDCSYSSHIRGKQQCTHAYTQLIFIILILFKIHWVENSTPIVGRPSPLVKNYTTGKAIDQLNLSNPS